MYIIGFEPCKCERAIYLTEQMAYIVPYNTHHEGKCHCTVVLLFEWFGFDQTSKNVSNPT